jgi:hypothetical protein
MVCGFCRWWGAQWLSMCIFVLFMYPVVVAVVWWWSSPVEVGGVCARSLYCFVLEGGLGGWRCVVSSIFSVSVWGADNACGVLRGAASPR